MDQREELLVILGLVENAGLLIAAVQDVVAAILGDDARGPWHRTRLAPLPIGAA
jgi:hypothetical protein